MQCLAITKLGTRCSRKALPNSKYCWQHQNLEVKESKTEIIPSKNILQVIPEDVFINIGKYLGYPEISNAKISKFPKKISYQKSCIVYVYDGKNNLDNLIKNLPKLTNLSINLTDATEHKEKLYYIIKTLKSFKNLEALTLSSTNYNININAEDIKINNSFENWLGFNNLKYLNISIFIYEFDIYSVVSKIPTLEYLEINSHWNLSLKFDNSTSKIPDTLKILEINSYSRIISDHNINRIFENLDKFSSLKGLIVSELVPYEFNKLTKLKNLDILHIDGDDNTYLLANNLNMFPTQIRFLYLEFIGYSNDSVFKQLILPNLEYFGMKNLGSLEHIINVLFKYPKLMHLYISEIKFSRLDGNPHFLKNLKNLKRVKPGLTLDFDTTKYETVSKQIQDIVEDDIYDKEDTQYQEMIDDSVSILDRETKAMKRTWPTFQKIFNLTEVVIDEKGHIIQASNQYPPEQWSEDNGYYVKEICNQ